MTVNGPAVDVINTLFLIDDVFSSKFSCCEDLLTQTCCLSVEAGLVWNLLRKVLYLS